MDHINILKRAWNILWRYRALWIFGIILALTTSSGGGGSSNAGGGGGNNSSGSLFEHNFEGMSGLPESMREGFGELGQGIERLVESGLGETAARTAIPLVIGLLCFGLALFIISRIARWVSEVSLIRMVDHTEETGEQLRFRQGLRLGWSRAAWRLFLMNLMIAIPMIIAFVLLVLIAAVPALMFINNIESPGGVIAVIATIGLFFLAILAIILVAVAIGILERFFWRTCVLEDHGIFDSIREGFGMVRRNLKDVGILWLIMVGVQIGYAILTIPVAFLLMAVGALLGGGIGLTAGAFTRLFAEGAIPWITGGVIGAPVFLLVLVLPLVFLSGLKETYVSSVWTLAYRELRTGETLKGTQVPDLPEPAAASETLDLPEPDAETGVSI